MAGTNKVLKEGQTLFLTGDKSDGMYLIRKGELRVYLEQNGKEVILTTIGTGSMIGEMSLFDGQARSASVKATKETEVTLISQDDFTKLMKQIPKWFVSLMTSLSGRLRQTNERLQKVEAGTKPKPYADFMRMLNIVNLLWHKDGEKDGKDIVLQKATAEKTLVEMFNEDPETVQTFFDVLFKEKVLATRHDRYKNVVLITPSRATLAVLATFIQKHVKSKPTQLCLSENALHMLKVLRRLADGSPYDGLTVSLKDLKKEGARDTLQTDNWERDAEVFATGYEEVKLVKTSDGLGLKTNKKDIASFARHHEILAAIYKANLV